ncbi:MAG: amino acid adenylation domain-containing protein [Lachnospiraceae bacterium]|jgi:amino acid adenylation domain-containing protein|nr:amino acid adenylation domain-containing protein [Lachnospiraceae bacterium]
MQNNILDYMNASCLASPDKVAFSDGSRHLTFREVREQCDAIGSYLAKNGIYQAPVLVFMGKHPDTVVTFFGVVRGGCYYVPLDAEMPRLRIEHILNNMNAPLMVCDKHTREAAESLGFAGRLVLYDDICKTDTDVTALAGIAERALDTDPIYIVHTSGSTGVPKGVVACHRSVIDYIEQLSEVLEFGDATIYGNQTPLYFDACLKEIYPTLKFGATTYLIPAELFMQPVKLVEFLNEHRINTICWVVSAMTMISAFDTFSTVVPEHLSSVNFGSEVFPLKELRKWRAALPGARFTNLYGPTECTGMCCYYKVTDVSETAEAIPIGRPFKNTEIILLDENDRRVTSAGIDKGVGEICVRGTSLTLGYYNDFEKTGAAFVQNPLNPHYPELIYRTGDLGYRNAEGELVFCSRKDHQIKHMGHRIELGEIEASVHRLTEIKMACAVYDKEKNKIRLYYVGDITSKEVTERLKELLPRYMMPNAVKQIERMPLTANGKIDRGALLNMG